MCVYLITLFMYMYTVFLALQPVLLLLSLQAPANLKGVMKPSSKNIPISRVSIPEAHRKERSAVACYYFVQVRKSLGTIIIIINNNYFNSFSFIASCLLVMVIMG